jgi:hypothetical protein
VADDDDIIDAEIVEDDPPGRQLVPLTARQVAAVSTALTKPTGPDLAWWRLGPNIRDRNKFAHDYGVVDVIVPPGALLTLVWRDGHHTGCPVADYRVEWNRVTVKDGWSDRPEDTTHHVKLMYVDILVARPPALPEPTPWQQMTRRGDERYPGNDMAAWTFNDPWEDTPSGFYPINSEVTPPRQKPGELDPGRKEIEGWLNRSM